MPRSDLKHQTETPEEVKQRVNSAEDNMLRLLDSATGNMYEFVGLVIRMAANIEIIKGMLKKQMPNHYPSIERAIKLQIDALTRGKEDGIKWTRV